jgi:hypothetical protein
LDDDSAAEDLDGDDGMGGAGDGDDLVMDVGEGGERVLILRRPQSGAQQRKITLKMLQEVSGGEGRCVKSGSAECQLESAVMTACCWCG